MIKLELVIDAPEYYSLLVNGFNSYIEFALVPSQSEGWILVNDW